MVGIGSIGLGVLMHPYFPIYWAAMICLGFLLALIEKRVRFNGWDILRFDRLSRRLKTVGVLAGTAAAGGAGTVVLTRRARSRSGRGRLALR